MSMCEQQRSLVMLFTFRVTFLPREGHPFGEFSVTAGDASGVFGRIPGDFELF